MDVELHQDDHLAHVIDGFNVYRSGFDVFSEWIRTAIPPYRHLREADRIARTKASATELLEQLVVKR